MLKFLFTLILSAFVCVHTSGCEDISDSGLITDGRVVIANNASEATGSVTLTDEALAIDNATQTDFTGSQGSSASQRSYASTTPFSLRKVAQVDAPVANGVTLQANDVVVHSNLAYVGYNVQGETFLGGVQIISILDADAPELLAEMIFLDADVNGVYLHGNDLYLALAVNPDQDGSVTSPAALEKVRLSTGGVAFAGSLGRIDLPSFAATDIVRVGNDILVTSGTTDGGLSIVDLTSYGVTGFVPIDDARGVDQASGTTATVVSGTPGAVHVIDISAEEILSTTPIFGAATEVSKATVQMIGDYAYLGVGEGGFQVIDTGDGSLVLDVPQVEYGGLPLGLTVSNAVTVDRDFAFIASGEAGVTALRFDNPQVSRVDDALITVTAAAKPYPTPTSVDARLVGQVIIGVDLSVNMVEVRQSHLFAAAGLGGLSIILIDE